MDDAAQTAGPMPDRYVSFCNIECDAKAQRILPLARNCLAAGDYLENPFWQRFDARAAALEAGGDGEGPDALYLVCSHVMYLAEIFEDDGAAEGRALLEDIELQCC